MSFSKTYTPKILFIKGVFKKNCMMDDFFEKKILENIDSNFAEPNVLFSATADGVAYRETGHAQPSKPAEKYCKLPSVFTDIEAWPDLTNILCWNCSLSFDHVPIFIPKVIEPIMRHKDGKKLSITPEGTFCGFGCAHRFIQTQNFSIIDRIEKLNKLKFFYKLLYGEAMPTYHSFPSPHSMVQYGGDVSIDDFKKNIAAFRQKFEI
jgi:hypothetical protein